MGLPWCSNDTTRVLAVLEKFADAAQTAARAYERAVMLSEQGIEMVKEMQNEAEALAAYDGLKS